MGEIWTYATTELMIAFIGGIAVGVFTTFISEYFSNKREHNALLMDRMANLVRTYQIYVRLLRKDDLAAQEEALDNAHATFLAEARILGFNKRFAAEAEAFQKLARKLVNIRQDCETRDQKRAALSKIYKEFDDTLVSAMAKFR